LPAPTRLIGDEAGECRADRDRDREVDDVAFRDEFLETL
jgi:hypothetical protein